jgi:hypothetical protein
MYRHIKNASQVSSGKFLNTNVYKATNPNTSKIINSTSTVYTRSSKTIKHTSNVYIPCPKNI